MKTSDKLAVVLEAFFTDRLINEKRASPHTIASYSDTFQLLLKYAAYKLKKQPSELKLTDLNDKFIRDFLMDLEKNRNNTPQTRNVRLTAIKSFFQYASFQEPGKSALIGRVLAIQKKKANKNLIHYLTPLELKALLASPDLDTWIGRRDYAIILVATETGLRLSELNQLKWENIHMADKRGYIQCIGKGRKERSCMLSQQTCRVLQSWKKETEISPFSFVYPTKHGERMSPDCVQWLLKKYKRIAEKKCPSLKGKKISPHVLRHTAAMNFHQAGVDLATIAIMLGHESVETTQIYLKADLKLKEEVLNKLGQKKAKTKRFKPDDKLIAYLKSLK